MFLFIIFAVLVGDITCQSRIIGGKNAFAGDFPYQVSLQLNGRRVCGGAIISETFIVTAAHCTFGENPSDMKAIVGTANLLAGDGIPFGIAELINHPQYHNQSHDYDISLIRLNNALPLGTYKVDKIEMVAPETILTPNTLAVVSGYGRINAKLQSTNYLKYVYVPLWGPDSCNAEYHSEITDRMICAGNPSGQESACLGDSGGPLALNNELLGVVSWGFGCGAERPAIYTDVRAFRGWIRQQSGV